VLDRAHRNSFGLATGPRIGFAVLALCALAVLAGCETNNQGYEPRQPIAYSHATHAGGAQIECTYCHFQAERGRYAGIPPAQVCMNCHTQVLPDNVEVQKVKAAIDNNEPIQWVRVHRLPDHAYFNHSAHVVTGDIECQECHGPVESMGLVRQEEPLTMGWCLDCHRTEQPARPAPSALGLVQALAAGELASDSIADSSRRAALVLAGQPVAAAWLLDCSVCHR
jgi:hypothetical protein